MRWGLAQRTAAGSVLLALAVAAGFGGLILAIAGLARSSDTARRDETEIVTADALERLLLELETAQRGFVITGQEPLLQPALRAGVQLPALERRLHVLVAGDSVQQRRAASIGRAIDAYQRDYANPLLAAARTDPARARRIVAAGVGTRLLDGIRAEFARFTEFENRQLAASRGQAASDARRAYWAAGTAAAVVLLLVVAFTWLLRRLVIGPVRALARGARSFGQGDLASRVEVTGHDEVAELGAAFNEMAGSLEGALGELTAEQGRIEALYRFSEQISAETDVEELGLVALEQLGELTGAELGALYAGDGEELRLAASRGVAEESLSPFARPERITLGRLGELALPLRHGERLVGVAVLAHANGEQLDPESVAAAERLVGGVATALSNDLAYREARRLADVNRVVLDATRDGIWMIDLEGTQLLSNSTFLEQVSELGLSNSGSFDDLTLGAAALLTEPELFLADMRGALEEPAQETATEVTFVGSGRQFVVYSIPAREAERIVGRVFVLREVTRERQADRLKSELLATVSHELRTPLAGILGFAELLQRRELDEGTRAAYLATVHREAVRLAGLINDFLDLQRIEVGALNLVLEPLHLRDIVAEQLEIYARQSSGHVLELVTPDEPTEVLADPARIAQVVANLLSNAVKYSPEGGAVTVRVELHEAVVRVSVSDHGIGIAEADRPRIFEKFFRVDSSDTREIGGTGLGLALSREIVEAHGGRIGFESEPGKGSTFWFEFPALSRDDGDGRPRVLVVEQEESPLAGFLEADGFRVERAESGREAVQRAAAEPPALICLDVGLAGLPDGWELLARLKTGADTASTPVVVCTGSNGHRRAAALGAADVLAKPFSRDQLLGAVRRLLPGGGGRVLVVDDDETVRTLVSETLRSDGFEPVEAGDGVEALAEVERLEPDAIVLDLVMPHLDGFGVLERLHEGPGARIPVVVLTARDLTAAQQALLRSRAVSLLEKGAYSQDELRRLVRQAVGR